MYPSPVIISGVQCSRQGTLLLRRPGPCMHRAPVDKRPINICAVCSGPEDLSFLLLHQGARWGSAHSGPVLSSEGRE